MIQESQCYVYSCCLYVFTCRSFIYKTEFSIDFIVIVSTVCSKIKVHFVCVCINSSRSSSQSVSTSNSIWRQNSSLLEGTIWTQRNHHTIWGTIQSNSRNNHCCCVCISWAEEESPQLSWTTCKTQFSVSLSHHRSAMAVCVHLTLRCLYSGQDSRCLCPLMPPITSSPSSTQVSLTSSLYEHPPPRGSVLQLHSTWLLIFQVENMFSAFLWIHI